MANPVDTTADIVHRSPPLGLLAVVFAALFIASVAANFLMTDFAPYPVPYNPISSCRTFTRAFRMPCASSRFCRCARRFLWDCSAW
jgi:hypothetical protein